jgi:hypothetical protein
MASPMTDVYIAPLDSSLFNHTENKRRSNIMLFIPLFAHVSLGQIIAVPILPWQREIKFHICTPICHNEENKAKQSIPATRHGGA